MSDATNGWDDVPDWGGIGALTGKVSTIVDGAHTYHRVADAVEHAGPE